MWIVLQLLSSSVHIAADHAGMFSVGQLSELSELLSETSATSLNVSAIFMGMGSTIFFYLSLRARYIPVVLSGLGIFVSLMVVAACFAKLILPEYTSTLDLAFIPTGLSEVTTGFWLMVKGLNPRVPTTQSVNSIPARNGPESARDDLWCKRDHPLMAQRLMRLRAPKG
jgi:hypothetical protein